MESFAFCDKKYIKEICLQKMKDQMKIYHELELYFDQQEEEEKLRKKEQELIQERNRRQERYLLYKLQKPIFFFFKRNLEDSLRIIYKKYPDIYRSYSYIPNDISLSRKTSLSIVRKRMNQIEKIISLCNHSSYDSIYLSINDIEIISQ